MVKDKSINSLFYKNAREAGKKMGLDFIGERCTRGMIYLHFADLKLCSKHKSCPLVIMSLDISADSLAVKEFNELFKVDI